MKIENLRIYRLKGYNTSGWLIMDFVEVPNYISHDSISH